MTFFDLLKKIRKNEEPCANFDITKRIILTSHSTESSFICITNNRKEVNDYDNNVIYGLKQQRSIGVIPYEAFTQAKSIES